VNVGALIGIAADAVVLLHFAFVLFVGAGGLLVLRWRWLGWLHVPAAAWGVLVELAGWTCPLTPLENRLRAAAGEAAYDAGFVEHYILPLLYPADFTRYTQLALGSVALVLNLAIYAWILRQR
jgi:hypothetical protein